MLLSLCIKNCKIRIQYRNSKDEALLFDYVFNKKLKILKHLTGSSNNIEERTLQGSLFFGVGLIFVFLQYNLVLWQNLRICKRTYKSQFEFYLT